MNGCAKLLQGDCFELMKGIPDGSIDLVLTDPPYGTTYNKWDVKIDLDTMMKEFLRVTKKNAAILVFTQQPFTTDVINACRKYFRYEWILEKAKATGFLNAHKMPMKAHENMTVFYKALPTYNPIKTSGKPFKAENYGKQKAYNYRLEHAGAEKIRYENKGTRNPRDVVRGMWNNAFQKKYNPTQKPVKLCEYFIETYSNNGDTVLDPFMGSGTTGVACKRLGRKFIGMEKEEEYFNIAKERISVEAFVYTEKGNVEEGAVTTIHCDNDGCKYNDGRLCTRAKVYCVGRRCRSGRHE